MKKTFIKALCLATAASTLIGCGNYNEQNSLSTSAQDNGLPTSKSDVCYETTPTAILNENGNATATEYYCEDECATDGDYSSNTQAASDDSYTNTEEYTINGENAFTKVSESPLSTFGADVDTASYTNFRRMVNQGYTLDTIPAGSIRVEEMLNYFDYDDLSVSAVNLTPEQEEAFSVTYETGVCPWNNENGLLVMNIKANQTNVESKGTNFVFLIDTSGSMSYPEDEKIDLVISSFNNFLESLGDDDTISVVTYSGTSETLIEGSSDKGKIKEALQAAYDSCMYYGGGTNGSGGITAAYEIANKYFIEGGNNRVIIASDGDMNLGLSTSTELTELITSEKESGVYLTVLGFGTGNYSDTKMEAIADAGNGNYFYIDCLEEAKRVLCDKLAETTVTVAKDVKFQVEFNPNKISSYRLVGYENRTMAAEDFEDDTKDGGEVGAGQDVTVVYELVYSNGESSSDLRYQEGAQTTEIADSDEILALSIRYKKPAAMNSDDEKSVELSFAISNSEGDNTASFTFATAVVESALIISSSSYAENANLENATARAHSSAGDDSYKVEFADLLDKLQTN